MSRALSAAFGAAATLFAAAAFASHAPPWIASDVPGLPSGTQSARIRLSNQPLFSMPTITASRRGTVAEGVLLPVFARRTGDGCAGAFLAVGPSAWVCDAAVDLSSSPPIDARLKTIPEAADGLPFHYFFAGPGGSFAYSRLEEADLGEPVMQLEPGFSVAIVGERVLEGVRYGRTSHDLWVPMRDFGAAHALAFHGEEIPKGENALSVAWVISDKATVLSKPDRSAVSSVSKARFEVVRVLEQVESASGSFIRIGEGAWLGSNHVRRPMLAEPPSEIDVDAGERWIDVDLGSQTLVAYEGRHPVFTTMISAGKGRPGSALATPKGVFRIWIKLLSSDMDNLEDENAYRYYRIEDVPYVQYFSKGVGLHGAFWHRSFGRARSHGCVNLAPLDAQRLFWWTGPHLPAGWTAVYPSAHERGTLIRVH